jgi:hypothetical protein
MYAIIRHIVDALTRLVMFITGIFHIRPDVSGIETLSLVSEPLFFSSEVNNRNFEPAGAFALPELSTPIVFYATQMVTISRRVLESPADCACLHTRYLNEKPDYYPRGWQTDPYCIT